MKTNIMAVTLTVALFVVGCAATMTVQKGTILPVGTIVKGVATTQVTTAPTTEQVIEPTTQSTAVATGLGTAQAVTQAVAPFLGFIPGWGTVGTTAALALAAGFGLAKKLSSGETVPQAIEDGVQGAEAVAAAVLPAVAPGSVATVNAIETTVNAVLPVATAVVAEVTTAQGPVAVTPAPTNAS